MKFLELFRLDQCCKLVTDQDHRMRMGSADEFLTRAHHFHRPDLSFALQRLGQPGFAQEARRTQARGAGWPHANLAQTEIEHDLFLRPHEEMPVTQRSVGDILDIAPVEQRLEARRNNINPVDGLIIMSVLSS